jgi:hypothetical protein
VGGGAGKCQGGWVGGGGALCCGTGRHDRHHTPPLAAIRMCNVRFSSIEVRSETALAL